MTTLDLDIALRRDDFSLEVRETLALDGITGLAGASGAGKTTLLRVIAGLEHAAGGRVALGGSIWQDDEARRFVPPYRRPIGYVFQEGRLFAHLTVANNLRFAARLARGPIDAADAIAALDLSSLLHRRPASLSAGERQRVAIARSLVRAPELLMMDEPLSSLDDARKREILPYIDKLPERFGLPVLYVTHNVEELTRLASRVLLLDRGKSIAHGSVVEVLGGVDLPALGGELEAGSVLEARVAAHRDDMTSLDLGGLELRVPTLDLAPGTAIRIRVPARDVALAIAAPTGLSIRNALPGRITSVSAGAAGYADVVLEVARQRLRARVTANAVRELGLAVGQPVYALVKSIAFQGRLLG